MINWNAMYNFWHFEALKLINYEFEFDLTLNLAYEWFKFGNPDWIMITLKDLSSLPAKHSLKLIDRNERIIFRRLAHQNILISEPFRETKLNIFFILVW